MFLFTVTKPGLRQAGALALCAVCLAGTVTAAVRLAGKSVAASATVQTTIENTQDIGTYFTGYGFEVDLSGLITATQTAAEAEQQAAETSAALPDEADYPSE